MRGQVMVMSSRDGVTWTAPRATPAASAWGPAISATPPGNQLMLSYAESGSKVIYSLNSSDGLNWSGLGQCTGETQDAPFLLASATGLMIAAYRASDKDDIFYGITKAGTWPVA